MPEYLFPPIRKSTNIYNVYLRQDSSCLNIAVAKRTLTRLDPSVGFSSIQRMKRPPQSVMIVCAHGTTKSPPTNLFLYSKSDTRDCGLGKVTAVSPDDVLCSLWIESLYIGCEAYIPVLLDGDEVIFVGAESLLISINGQARAATVGIVKVNGLKKTK